MSEGLGLIPSTERTKPSITSILIGPKTFRPYRKTRSGIHKGQQGNGIVLSVPSLVKVLLNDE